VLGCEVRTTPAAPRDPVEAIRARIRARAALYGKGIGEASSPAEVAQRLGEQPALCLACERELLAEACPVCAGPLAAECAGDAVHCARPRCRSFYTRLARRPGAPVRPRDPWRAWRRWLGLGLAAGVLLVGLLVATLGALLAGVPRDLALMPLTLLVGVLGLGVLLLGPLLLFMRLNRRED
jgi:hypothetical protein